MSVGARINRPDGEMVVLIGGGSVLKQRPELLSAVGEIAADWAHAEAELERCLAALMDTPVKKTFALLQPYRSAGELAKAAETLARVTMGGEDLEAFETLIKGFRTAAEERNKLQHAMWALRPDRPSSLFRVKAKHYSDFVVRLIALNPEQAIRLADDFAAGLKDEYDLPRMKSVIADIQKLILDFNQRSNELAIASMRKRITPVGGSAGRSEA